MDLEDARRYVADMLAGMDVRYDLGGDHRFVGTLCPDMKLTLERPDPEVVTAVTRSADLPREQRELLLDLVDRAKARDAAASWTGRVNTVTPRHGPGGRRRAAHPAPRLSRPGLAHRGRTSTPPRRCVRRAHGPANRPEHRINSRLRFPPYEVGVQMSDATRM